MYQKEKEEIIEMFGIHFESYHNIPPLASRILGILIVDSLKQGLTFENLVEMTGASKSSVSTNLNLLLKLEKITYYTLPHDRKKYFKPSPFSHRLQNYMKMLEYEKILIDKMENYREKTAQCDIEQLSLCNIKEYKIHVEEVGVLIKKTIERFKEIENSNQIQS